MGPTRNKSNERFAGWVYRRVWKFRRADLAGKSNVDDAFSGKTLDKSRNNRVGTAPTRGWHVPEPCPRYALPSKGSTFSKRGHFLSRTRSSSQQTLRKVNTSQSSHQKIKCFLRFYTLKSHMSAWIIPFSDNQIGLSNGFMPFYQVIIVKIAILRNIGDCVLVTHNMCPRILALDAPCWSRDGHTVS